MEFHGPERADFANVYSLNRAYLRYLSSASECDPQLRRLSPPIARRLADLSEKEQLRLARAPFLLQSYREHDMGRWERLFCEQRNGDLLALTAPLEDDLARLASAGLGFLWQLAKREPYAVRVLSGASFDWCERLAESTLFELYSNIADHGDIVEPRFANNPGFWNKLLGAGLSTKPDVQAAARICALQTVLTRHSPQSHSRLRVAARNIRPSTASSSDVHRDTDRR